MDTILTAKLDSDEEDEDYEDDKYVSDSTSEEETAEGKVIEGKAVEKEVLNFSKKRKKRNSQKSTKKLRKLKNISDGENNEAKRRSLNFTAIDDIFREMHEESLETSKHTSPIEKDDFMLQFHRKYPKSLKKTNETEEALLHHLKISVSSPLLDDEEKFSLLEFKKQCRQTKTTESTKAIQEAVQMAIRGDYDSQIKVTTDHYYAGKLISIEKFMNKESNEYKNHLMKSQRYEANLLGGQLSAIDAYLNQLDKSANVLSSVEKSVADWDSYKQKGGVSDSLKNNASYLDNIAFLRRAEWNEHEKYLQNKTKATKEFNG